MIFFGSLDFAGNFLLQIVAGYLLCYNRADYALGR